MAATSPSQLVATQIAPATGGADLVSAPEAVPALKARALTNFLVDRPGKLVPRGPLVGAALGGSVDTVAAVSKPGTIFLSKKTGTVGRTMFPWETHLGLPNRTAHNETQLVRADINLRTVDLGTFQAASQALADIGLVPGPRSTQLGGLTYAISLDSSGDLTGGDTALLADGSSLVRKTEILSLDSGGSALPSFSNPSFTTNTTGWSVTGAGTTITRDTSVFVLASPPGSGKWHVEAAASTLVTTLVGTFKAGVTYTVHAKVVSTGGALAGDTFSVALGSLAASGTLPRTPMADIQLTFTPAVDTATPVLTLTGTPASTFMEIWFDDFTVTQAVSSKAGANAPMCAQDITSYLSRLFVLGGAAPGSSPGTLTLHHRTLWWTDPGGPVFSDLNTWKDDVSGLVNQIVVGDEDPTDPGVALGRLPSRLLVFGRRSLWAVLGNSPTNFTVRRIAVVGCLDPRSVVEYGDTVYWLSEQGFMAYDGSTLTNLSRSVQPALLAAADQSVGLGGAAGGSAIATVLQNGYIKLSIARRDTDTQLFLGYLHTPTGAWSTLASAAQTGAVHAAFNANGAPYFVDDNTLWLASAVTQPERNPVADKGAVLPDVSQDSRLLSGAVTLAAKIQPFWATRMIALSSPLYGAQLHRYLQDYIWVDPNQTLDDATTGWHVRVLNSRGEVLGEYDLPTSAVPTGHPIRRRQTQDNFSEVSSDMWLEFSVASSAPEWSSAELYTATIEYQQTRQRSTD